MKIQIGRSLAAGLGLFVTVLFGVSPAAAQPAPVVTLTVLKVVNGTFSANTVFSVSVVCNLDNAGNDVNTTLSFSADGTPIGSNVIGLNENDGVCLVKETGTGGAALVTYACTDNANAVDPPTPNGSTCEGLNGSGEFVVDYDVVVANNLAATVTITNTPGIQNQVITSVPAMDATGLIGTVIALAIFGVFAVRRRQREKTRQ